MVTEMRSYLPDLPALSRGNWTYFDEGGKEKKKKNKQRVVCWEKNELP